FNCLVCDACSAVCPAGVHMDPLQVGLRTALQASRSPSLMEKIMRWIVFGWLFMDMRRFRLFARLLWLYQRSGLRWLARPLGVLKVVGVDAAERLLPDLPARFLVAHGEQFRSATADGTPAALFGGCVMSTALADIDRATIRVLQTAGFVVCNPTRQGCCGA